MTSVAVVGGGLAGLVAARRLADAGLEVQLFERRGELGGRVRTREVDGFTLDRGFQVLFTAYPAVRRELDLDALDLRHFPPGATIARPGHRSTLSDPVRDPTRALATLLNDDVGALDKFRVLRLQRELRRRDYSTLFPGPDTDIRTFLSDRGFSERFIERFAAPFYGGITLDRSLSTAAAVFAYTFKAMSEGGIAVPAAGMGAIPAQLANAARAAGATIETESEVVDLHADDDGAGLDLGDRTLDVDATVLATDPLSARSMTSIQSIPTAARGCVTQYYSLPASVGLEPSGRLVINAGGTQPNHVAALSQVASEYAPEGQHLLAATFLGESEDDDEELAALTRTALESWFPEAAVGALEAIHTDRIAFAQFAQPPGVHDGLPAPDEPAGPVYLAGDYTQWSSIQGALESGIEAAGSLLRDLE